VSDSERHQSTAAIACYDVFVALATQQLIAIADFYSALFGKAPAILVPQRYAEFHLPGLKLGIFRPQANHQPEFDAATSGAMSLCLEVDDLEHAIATVTALGYPPAGQPAIAAHGREIYAYDPDGNRLILHQSTRD